MLDITKAEQIEGWMTYDELFWLADQSSQHKAIVEIGSFLGRSTRALADNTSGTVYAVDDWIGPRDVSWNITPPDFYKIFNQNIEDLSNIVVVKSDHSNIQLDVVPDMVFIDGDHAYESVVRDIKYWHTRLAPGGLLCGHDLQLPTVQNAVTNVLGTMNQAPGTYIWFAHKSEHDRSKETQPLMIRTHFQ